MDDSSPTMCAPNLSLDALCFLLAKLESDPISEADAIVRRGSSTLLVDLPPELLTAICALADCRSVVRCRSVACLSSRLLILNAVPGETHTSIPSCIVCRLLRDVIDTSLELQYRIELARDGMIDGGLPSFSPSHHHSHAWPGYSPFSPPSHEVISTTSARPTAQLLTLSDRLARLRELRKAWKTLSWTRCVTVPMSGPCCAYELVGGVFCKTQPRVRGKGLAGAGAGFGNGWYGWPGFMDGDGNGMGRGDAHLWLVYHVRDVAPGEIRSGAYGGERRSRDSSARFRDGSLAGLDGVVQWRPVAGVFAGALELHIRTISTNQTHPEARVPVLCTPVLYPITSVFVHIVDDIVGMMYCVDPARPRITLWNWKTGNPVVDRSSGNLPPGTWDFSFIHSRALFVTTGNGGGSLELFTFTCDRADADPNGSSCSNSQPQSQAHRTHAPTSPLIHVATLHLPPVHPSVRVLSVGTHTGPFLAGCPPDKPFVASNEERIHVLTIQYIHLMTLDGPRTGQRVCMFVHNRTLERYLNRGAERGVGIVSPSGITGVGEATTAMVVPWREWGQTHARILPHAGTFQWLRWVVSLKRARARSKSSILTSTAFSTKTKPENEGGADAHIDHTGEGSGQERNENNDDADPSLRKTTLEHVNYPTRIVMPNVFTDGRRERVTLSRSAPGRQGRLLRNDDRRRAVGRVEGVCFFV
ncbi:hypothetical protein J3R83DRAFT_9092 [Lanmaoa asiatica]|nr:hypothetical protein J3R83DRAFT_9092 [Lanmaoa asiatica]